MASTPQALLGFFSLFLVMSAAAQTAAGRNIPTDAKAQPQWLGKFDGSVLIPGIGRYMIPKNGVKSFHYNPITGAPEGNGVSIPGFGGSTDGGTGSGYIPGGDDTFLPNPGVEAPVPGAGGRIPAPSHP